MADLAARAANYMYDGHQARAPFSNLPVDLTPKDEAGAYQIQDTHVDLLRKSGTGAVAGYKIGLSAAVMQNMFGTTRPCMGVILSDRVWPAGHSVRHGDYVNLSLECEIAVRVSADLSPDNAPFTRDSVAGAVAACHPAFELIDDRNAEYTTCQASSLIADNAWNMGVVLGPEVSDWRALDFSATRGTLTVNGAEVGQGVLTDAMGHPFEALAWLANLRAERGLSIERGALVMTGSIVPPAYVQPGDEAAYSVENMGEVTAKIV